MIADIITISRIPLSLGLFAFSPPSPTFSVLYLLCGVSDVLDGFLARKLHTESKAGEMLDSIADLFFAAAYAVKVLPFLRLPIWILIWTAMIAGVKIIGILKKSRKERTLYIPHSFANKFIGLLIFLLPMTVCLIDIKYSATVVCAIATAIAAAEFLPL